MTKAEMLKAMTSPGNVNTMIYYHKHMRKEPIAYAYFLYVNVSHNKGREYLKKARCIKYMYQKGKAPKYAK